MDDLQDYLIEIEKISDEENEMYLENSLKMLAHLRRQAKTSLQASEKIQYLLRVIYCHRLRSAESVAA